MQRALERPMTAVRLIVLTAVAIVATSGASLSPAPPARPATPAPCVYWFRSPFSLPCARFTTVGIRVLHSIPSSAFGNDRSPQDIAAFENGSLMVQTDGYGLYRIVNGRLQKLWPPTPRCGGGARFAFAFADAFDSTLALTVSHGNTIAVHADGSVAFRLMGSFESVARDADGVVWLLEGRYPTQRLNAYLPTTRAEQTLPPPNGDIYRMFLSPNGHVYVSNFHGLFELDSSPVVRARVINGGIHFSPKMDEGAAGASVFPVQAVGRDGSLWASTATEVVHMRPNGAIRIMRFIEPPASITMPWGAIGLRMAPDGSVWVTGGTLARIDNDDRITVLNAPTSDERSDVKFGPDSSLWVIARDARTGQPQGIVNFVPAGAGRRLTPWPFTTARNAPPPTPFSPCPRSTPPPTPTPPLPPASGRVNFVYSGGYSSEVWGFWAARNGKLTPVRGSPFATIADAVTLTIDPAGRYLYAGTWYHGIIGYAIEARTGTLHPISGSPFASGSGPSSVAITADGRYAYSSNVNGKAVTGYAIDSATGALRQLTWSPYAMDTAPFRIALNGRRNLAYIATGGTIETFDTGGGEFRLLGKMPLRTLGDSAAGILVERQARRLYLSHDPAGTISISEIEPKTGMPVLPALSIVKGGNEPRAMVTDPRGRFLYVTNIPSIGQKGAIVGYRVDARTGMLTPLPTSPFGGASGNLMTITPDGAFLYLPNFGSKSITGFRIDENTGALWPVPGSPFEAGMTPDAIASCRRVGDRCPPSP